MFGAEVRDGTDKQVLLLFMPPFLYSSVVPKDFFVLCISFFRDVTVVSRAVDPVFRSSVCITVISGLVICYSDPPSVFL